MNVKIISYVSKDHSFSPATSVSVVINWTFFYFLSFLSQVYRNIDFLVCVLNLYTTLLNSPLYLDSLSFSSYIIMYFMDKTVLAIIFQFLCHTFIFLA